jgi:hypothetical protein
MAFQIELSSPTPSSPHSILTPKISAEVLVAELSLQLCTLLSKNVHCYCLSPCGILMRSLRLPIVTPHTPISASSYLTLPSAYLNPHSPPLPVSPPHRPVSLSGQRPLRPAVAYVGFLCVWCVGLCWPGDGRHVFQWRPPRRGCQVTRRAKPPLAAQTLLLPFVPSLSRLCSCCFLPRYTVLYHCTDTHTVCDLLLLCVSDHTVV